MRGRLDWIKQAIGQGKYAKMEARHVAMLMERKGGPAAANRLRKDLGQLYRFAAKRFLLIHESPLTDALFLLVSKSDEVTTT